MGNISELFRNATEESKSEYLSTLLPHHQLLVKMCAESGVDLYEMEMVPEGAFPGGVAMTEDNKTTSFGHDNPFCLDCGRKMMARRDDDGEWRYVHYSASECPNAGKKFKVATVELE